MAEKNYLKKQPKKSDNMESNGKRLSQLTLSTVSDKR